MSWKEIMYDPVRVHGYFYFLGKSRKKKDTKTCQKMVERNRLHIRYLSHLCNDITQKIKSITESNIIQNRDCI